MGLFEVVGIASILPFMQLLSEPDAIAKSTWLTLAYETFNFSSTKQMIIISGVGIIILLFITNVFSILATWLQYKYSWDIAHNIAMRLLKTYLNKPYQFYLNSNSSKLQGYLISEVTTLTGGVIIPIIEVISKLFISLVIFGLLLMIDLKISIIMFGGLGSAYILIYLSQKGTLKQIGHQRINMNLLRFKHLKEVLDGIKTVKVYNKQEFFFNRYQNSSREFCNVQPKYNLILATPRSIVEFLAFGSILGITILMYNSSQSILAAIPRLTLYVVAGYRLMPALQKIFAAFAKIKHNFPIVGKLYEDLIMSHHTELVNEQSIKPIAFKNNIRIDHLSYQYATSEDSVIANLDITIEKGTKVAFIGSTGSGKTTLVDIIVGLLGPTQGGIRVDEVKLSDHNIKNWQKIIAYVPQEVFLFDDTVLNNITLIENSTNQVDLNQIKRVTKLAGIYDFIHHELPDGLKSLIGEKGVRLSGGQRQRIGLARALYKNPEVLVLDEATSALDSLTESSIIASLKTLPNDLTTIVVAHRLSTVKNADCIYIMERGKIKTKGTYNSLIESSDQFKKMVSLS